MDLASVEERLRAQRVETPSWGYGDTGTRFAVFPQKGVPRDPFEKIADAAAGARPHRRVPLGGDPYPLGQGR